MIYKTDWKLVELQSLGYREVIATVQCIRTPWRILKMLGFEMTTETLQFVGWSVYWRSLPTLESATLDISYILCALLQKKHCQELLTKKFGHFD